MISRRELKQMARMRLSQADPGYLKVMVVYMLAAVVVPQVALTVVSPPVEVTQQLYELITNGVDMDRALQLLQISPLQGLLQQALSWVLRLYQVVMVFGLTRYCLCLYRGEPCGPADLFVGFSMVGRVLAQAVLVWLILSAWLIGAGVVMTVLTATFAVSLSTEAAYGVGIVIGCVLLVGLIYILLNFSLATLALADRPELGAMGAIQYSKTLMRGQKGKYIVLSLSFFGWSLLCMLPFILFGGASVLNRMAELANAGFLADLSPWVDCLISLVLSLPMYLWLTPYMNTAIAGFYDSLHNQGFQPPDPGAAAWPR